MNYEEYKTIKANFNTKLDEITDLLNSLDKDEHGLIKDIKSPVYQNLKLEYNKVFKRYQQFNSLKDSKAFAKRMRQEKLAYLKKV